MKTELLWIPFLSATLLCAGNHRPALSASENPTQSSMQTSTSSTDAGPPILLPPDPGPESSSPPDAGTALSFPDPAEVLQGDVSLDGAGFKAIRAAMEDLKPRNRTRPPDTMEACFDDESAYDIQIQKRGNHYFVSIMMIPERCDPTGVYFDGGVRYIIDTAGNILLKKYSGQR